MLLSAVLVFQFIKANLSARHSLFGGELVAARKTGTASIPVFRWSL